MDLKKNLRAKELEQCFNALKQMYGSEIPSMLNSVREAVEDGLTNTMLIDEVLAMKVETEEGKQILGTLDGQGKRPPQSIDIASIFYSLRSLSDLLERINRYINEEHH